MNAFRRGGYTLGGSAPGPRGTIADVPGVRVGHATRIEGEGPCAVRTGVTVVVPPGDVYARPCPAGAFVLHGHGKAAGLWQLIHLGALETPLIITNTLAVGVGFDALVSWTLARHPHARSINPVVLECNDGYLSAIEARPVREEDAREALAHAADDVAEGCVGAGTGMRAFGHKSGVGTASCRVGAFSLGALVVPNMGRASDLRCGFADPELAIAGEEVPEQGSVVVVLATDAPLLPRQLGLLARRGALGLARTGAPADPGSGDFLVAFSTGWRLDREAALQQAPFIPDAAPATAQLYRGAAQVTEEAVWSAMIAAEALTGRDGRSAPRLRLLRRG